MDNKLSDLSKPVMYVVRTLDGSVASVKNYKYTAPKGFTSNPLYSQEYVSALLADRDAWQASALALRDELRVSQAIANECQQLMCHMDAGGDFFKFQRDKNNG